MARFEKAVPIKKPLKMSCYGKQGTGKSLTSLIFAEGLAKRRGGRIAIVDTDPGSGISSYLVANPAREVHPEAFDLDVLRTCSISDIGDALNALDPKVHTSVILDNVTHLWEGRIEPWERSNPGKKPTPADWGRMGSPYRKLMKKLYNSTQDVILVGREKTIFAEDDAGKLQNMGVMMKTAEDTPFDADICLHFFLSGKAGGTSEQPPAFFGEKDRNSILQGRTVVKPTWNTLAPLLPFLGVEAPPSEDEDERAARDGDLLDDSAKNAEKEAKSATIMSEVVAKVQAVTTMEALGAVIAEAKKLKRNVIATHQEALRQVFDAKANELSNRIAGAL